MKIAQKLGLLVGALLAMVLLTILVLSNQVSKTSSEYDGLIKNEIAQRAAAKSMQIVFGKQVLDFQQILLQASTPAEYTQLKKVYDQQVQAVDTLTSQLLAKVGPQDPRLKTSLEEFKTSHDAVTIAFRSALDAFVSSHYQSIAKTSQSVQGFENFPNDLIDNIVNYRQRSVDAQISQQSSSVARRMEIIYAGSAILLLLALLAVTAIVRGIVRPIRMLTTSALDAANERLPRVVAEIAVLPADSPTPTLPEFRVTTKDELAELAGALNSLQNSAVQLALEQRRNEEANAETLVNLGRRNQSLMTRMLSYVTDLERDERDPGTLDKLFRLDHLTTRIRRNAESLLVLAGAKQTRTWSHPIAMDDVLSAALSEIEEYTRVSVHHMDPAKVHGAVAADLTHMIAELLENATRFSSQEHQVLVVGRLTPSGYQFDLIDAGMGMVAEELDAANMRIAQASHRRPDTKVLGHHVVGRIAGRRGIFVRLVPSDQVGLTAMVLVPVELLSDAAIPATLQEITVVPMIGELPAGEPSFVAAPTRTPAVAAATNARPSYQPNYESNYESNYEPNYDPYPAAAAAGPTQPPQRRSAPARDSDVSLINGSRQLPSRRVRGAQLGDLAADRQQEVAAPVDPNVVRSQMSALQSGAATARREQSAQPNRYPPKTVTEDGAPVPPRRVRGAQLAELGAEITSPEAVPTRDPAAVGRQLAGLQAATNRVARETGRYHPKNDTLGGSI